jgi:hypothetical protein
MALPPVKKGTSFRLHGINERIIKDHCNVWGEIMLRTSLIINILICLLRAPMHQAGFPARQILARNDFRCSGFFCNLYKIGLSCFSNQLAFQYCLNAEPFSLSNQPTMPRFCFVLLVTLIVPQMSFGQVDTEFWFAPPEVTSGHGDRPIYLRISTLDKASQINVYQPGRANIRIATATIAANTTHTIDLTSQITNLETITPASVMKRGLRISATTAVSVYYEVGAPWNSDIFTLKGRNALGNRFVIPGQNFYDNGSSYSPIPSSSFDIVATKNNTVVKIRPTKALVPENRSGLRERFFGNAGRRCISPPLYCPRRGKGYSS